MNILIINQPPFNRGDESAHKGLVRALLDSYPNSEIHVLHEPKILESMRQYSIGDNRVTYIPYPNRFYKFSRFQWYGTRKGYTFLWHFHPTFFYYKKIYEWADLVVCAPGGICMGGFQNWDHVFHLMLAKFYKRQLVYFGRSIGPFATDTEDNRMFKKASVNILKYMSFISLRDSKSQNIADELGINYEKTVDSAFLDSTISDIPWEIKNVINGSEYVVFVPNYLLWHFAYKDRISHETVFKFYNRILDDILFKYPNYKVILLPQTFCMDTYNIDDVSFFRDMAEYRKDDRLIVIPNCYSSDIQQSIIRHAKCMIGARYHSIVFAINQGTPFIALSYEHKIMGLLETLGKESQLIDITCALDTQENQDAAIKQFKDALYSLVPDPSVKHFAKKIARDCYEKFLKSMKKA